MSAILAPLALPRTVVAVAPTTTTIQTFLVTAGMVLSVQITNLDGAQTFTGVIERRLDRDEAVLAPSPYSDLEVIPPGESRAVDINTASTYEIRISGRMSGAGGNVAASARRRTA
jgi:hypothetical protein